MRSVLAWILYGMGHALHVVFDRWLPCGMFGPIYSAYSGLMTLSSDVQGPGPDGPWSVLFPSPPESEEP